MAGPIERRSLQQQAGDWLRAEILQGRIAPDSLLTEQALSAQIGTGRGTVRAALFDLEAQELVVRAPYASWRVAPLDAQVIWEIYSLRSAYEGLAARILAERRAVLGCDLLRAGFARLGPAEHGDADQRVAADLGFHSSFVRQSGHRPLIRRHAQLCDKMEWLYRWSERHWPRRNPLEAEHRPLFEALLEGSPAQAEAEVRSHLEASCALDVAGYHSLSQEQS